jgi:hypothetical protein
MSINYEKDFTGYNQDRNSIGGNENKNDVKIL